MLHSVKSLLDIQGYYHRRLRPGGLSAQNNHVQSAPDVVRYVTARSKACLICMNICRGNSFESIRDYPHEYFGVLINQRDGPIAGG